MCNTCTRTARCARCRKRASRQANPIRTLYRDHVSNARRRGKVVLWSYDEFKEWCEFTGHHILHADGYVIHRAGDTGPYCAANCFSLPGVFNAWYNGVLRGRWKVVAPGARNSQT